MPASLWRESAAWRWVVTGTASAAALALIGQTWTGPSMPLPPARFAPEGGATGSTSGAAPQAPTRAVVPSPADPVPDTSTLTGSGMRNVASGSTIGESTLPRRPSQPLPLAAPSYSGVVWQSSNSRLNGSVTGGGLIASYCCAGAMSVVTTDRGITRGRHYWELHLSVPPGGTRASTWTGAGVRFTKSGEASRDFAVRGFGRDNDGALFVEVGRSATIIAGDTIMMALDADRGLAYWGVNGQWMNGEPGGRGGAPLAQDGAGDWRPIVTISAPNDKSQPEGDRWIANFGASRFRYPLPEGYSAFGGPEAAAAGVRRETPTQTASPSIAAAPQLAMPPKDSLMGRTVQGSVAVSGQVIPLAEGEWTVLAHFRGAAGSLRGDAVVLGRLQQSKLLGLVAINAFRDGAGAGQGFPTLPACSRTDLLDRDVIRNDAQGEQRCWWINHALSIWDEQAIFRAARGDLEQRGVATPTVLLNVGFRRANADGFATTHYYFDPASAQLHGGAVSWSASEWHKDRMASDPRRAEYVSGLRQWALGWAPIYFAQR